MKRILLYLILVIIVVVGGFALYFTLTVKPEKYRPLIERTLSEKVGREVSLGNVDFSFWGGIAFEIRDLKISGDRKFPDDSPLQFGKGKFKMKIIPLLFGRVRIKEVVVESPVLSLRKYRDGHLSIDDVLEHFRGEEKKEEAGDKAKKRPIDLEIESVRVVEGSFTYVAELPGKRVEKATLSPVNVKISDIGFDRKVETEFSFQIVEPVKGATDLDGFAIVSSSPKGTGDVTFVVSGNVFDVPVKVEGGIILSGKIPEFEIMAGSDDLEIKKVAKIYTAITGKDLPVRSKGKGRLLIAAGGNPDEFGFEGEMDLTKATLFYQERFEKYMDSQLNLVFQGRYIKPQVIISNAEFRLPQLLSSINGNFDTKSGSFELKSSFDITNLESLSQFFKDVSPLNLSGGLTTSAIVRGKKKGLQIVSVQTDLKEVNFDLSDKNFKMRSLGGHLEFGKDTFTLNPLSGLLNGQRVSLSGNLTLKENPKGEFNAKASYLDVDSILGDVDKGEKKGKKEAPKEWESRLKMLKKADISTTIVIDTLKYRGMEANKVSGTLHVKNGVVKWDGLEMGLFNGKVQTRGAYSLFTRDKPFEMDLSTSGVSLFDFLKRATSFGGFMDGVADLKISLKGNALSPAGLRKTLMGKGDINVKSGKIEGVDLFSDITGVAGIKDALEVYTGKSRFKRSVTVFDDVSAPFEIKGGDAVAKNFKFKTDSFQLKGSARFTADNRFLFSGDAFIPKSFTGKVGRAGKFIADKEGNLIVPINISGPINGPRVVLDAEGIVKRKGKEIIEKEKEKIEKKLLDTIKNKKLF